MRKYIMNKMLKLLLNDKFQHFVYGIAIYAVMIPFGTVMAYSFLIAVAVLKELYDHKTYRKFDVRDAAFTVTGGVYLHTWYLCIEELSTFI
jgi:hypothetical protein